MLLWLSSSNMCYLFQCRLKLLLRREKSNMEHVKRPRVKVCLNAYFRLKEYWLASRSLLPNVYILSVYMVEGTIIISNISWKRDSRPRPMTARFNIFKVVVTERGERKNVTRQLVIIASISNPSNNRPYSYSRYWTGTSLQLKIMPRNIIKKRLVSPN